MGPPKEITLNFVSGFTKIDAVYVSSFCPYSNAYVTERFVSNAHSELIAHNKIWILALQIMFVLYLTIMVLMF